VSEDELEEIISEIVAAANDVKDDEEQRMVVFRPNLVTTKEDYVRMVGAIEKEGHKAILQA